MSALALKKRRMVSTAFLFRRVRSQSEGVFMFLDSMSVEDKRFSHFRDELAGFKSRLEAKRPAIESLSRNQCMEIMLAFRDGVASNPFVPWIAATWSNCQSAPARDACKKNVVVELTEDHFQMFLDYIEPVTNHPDTAEIYARMLGKRRTIEKIRHEIDAKVKDGLSGLQIIAGVETGSTVFMLWLREAGHRLGLVDQGYIDLHTVADVEHAEEFSIAFQEELRVQEDSSYWENQVVRPLSLVERLIDQTFGL